MPSVNMLWLLGLFLLASFIDAYPTLYVALPAVNKTCNAHPVKAQGPHLAPRLDRCGGSVTYSHCPCERRESPPTRDPLGWAWWPQDDHVHRHPAKRRLQAGHHCMSRRQVRPDDHVSDRSAAAAAVAQRPATRPTSTAGSPSRAPTRGPGDPATPTAWRA